jgi:hypothetical protein
MSVNYRNESDWFRSSRMKCLVQSYLKHVYSQTCQIESQYEDKTDLIKSTNTNVIGSRIRLHELWQSRTSRDSSHIRLKFFVSSENDHQAYSFSNQSIYYSYCDRDSSWMNNSCALDCCIMTARLLKKDIIVADKDDKNRKKWFENLSIVQCAFLRLITRSWKRFLNENCFRIRIEFFNLLLEDLNRFNAEQINAKSRRIEHFFFVVKIWKRCTSMMNQFSFSKSRQSTCSRYETQSISNSQSWQNITLDQSDLFDEKRSSKNWDMILLINQYFEKRQKRCLVCANHTRFQQRIVYESLFSRLIVYLLTNVRDARIDSNSQRIFIKYQNSCNNTRKFLYRWLRDIYHVKNHFRLYWTNDNDRLMIYDDMKMKGIIMSQVSMINVKNKISSYWTKGVNILFYERIKAKNLNKLNVAVMNLIEEIVNIVQEMIFEEDNDSDEELFDSTSTSSKSKNQDSRFKDVIDLIENHLLRIRNANENEFRMQVFYFSLLSLYFLFVFFLILLLRRFHYNISVSSFLLMLDRLNNMFDRRIVTFKFFEIQVQSALVS